jgi:hypothetical protein
VGDGEDRGHDELLGVQIYAQGVAGVFDGRQDWPGLNLFTSGRRRPSHTLPAPRQWSKETLIYLTCVSFNDLLWK